MRQGTSLLLDSNTDRVDTYDLPLRVHLHATDTSRHYCPIAHYTERQTEILPELPPA